jgi:hypothetical protein
MEKQNPVETGKRANIYAEVGDKYAKAEGSPVAGRTFIGT